MASTARRAGAVDSFPLRAIEPVPSCPTPKPTPVTGASLGLQLTYDGSGAGAEVLVPSWLFSIEGSTSPSAVIAIDPAYLAGPDDSPGAGNDRRTGLGRTGATSGR